MATPTPLQAFSALPKTTPAADRQTIVNGEKMTGAKALVRALEDLGVQDVFGIPGGAILPVYHEINDDTKFRFVLMRHEQAAGHAAEGYAVATGRVGVCLVTSGPGATNVVTAIADANMDSVPMVVITGQVGVPAIGTDAFQEADIVGITYPVSKHSFLVTRAQDIPRVLTEAHYIARTGRPGPVVVDLTKTAQVGEMYYSWPQRMILPGYNPTLKAHGHVLRDAAKLFAQSYRPVLYVGGGAARSGAGELVAKLSEVTDAPIVTTLPARGVVPDSNPRNLGMLGMHGTIAATGAVQRSDLLVAIGARFDDRVTGKLDAFAPTARVIHIDIDPAEIGKNRVPDVPIVGDVSAVLTDLIPEIERTQAIQGKPNLKPWWDLLDDLRTKYTIHYDEPQDQPTDGSLSPQWVVEQLSKAADPSTIWVSGVGQHQMWAAQLVDFEKPNSWISSGGLGTMGYGLPAAIGASVGSQRDFDAKKPVWLIDGDGSFQMTSEELAAAFLDHVPVKIAILNNSVYGMVRQWQTLFYEHHYSQTNLLDGEAREDTPADEFFDVPDFVKLAEAYGCVGMRAFTKEEAVSAIQRANEINDRPVLIDFRVYKDAMVWPMVSAGASNDTVTYRPGVNPLINKPAADPADAPDVDRNAAPANQPADND
ncbi:acetolactate synthase large subunit [Bifidobacterium avesanii]|uniref:Acetolactate synthase n=1 Tax=Bifidobacterium avesanii TaxID=1798157 RepID=A0A7K3TFC6_9BIFI|nr:acetolactate synthase large subunit [Bifidobacterium avesanii]KAB8294367.1 acetolactate synthase 1 catalytic subunit [Bifidobacterium avesanii]NEG77798.1 acetolactate synthase large subunit [Bifidobacterium avesanii]